METIRKPLQGVGNIVKFNWHFYALSAVSLFTLGVITVLVYPPFNWLTIILCSLILWISVFSLLVSYYVYDVSDLYKFGFIEKAGLNTPETIINIHAGFDETSNLLKNKFPASQLVVLDFYDPVKHTEVSIKRARRAYPAYEGTIAVNTSKLPVEDISADHIYITLSAHEIRNDIERDKFFKELKRILKSNGKIIVTEHLRDTANFIAYSIGFFHFLPKSSWYKNFANNDLKLIREIKSTPFITSFILEKNGNTN